MRRNGIQVGYGVTERVTGNTVTENACTQDNLIASGILVTEEPAALVTDLVIRDNTLTDNTVGIALA